MSSFTKAKLLVSPEKDGINWQVEESFKWYCGPRPGIGIVWVHKGFHTDFDSTPLLIRMFSKFLLKGKDKGRRAHTLHDWGYRVNVAHLSHEMVRCSRKWWDEQYYDALIAEGVPKSTAKKMYFGVRLAGRFAFNKWKRHYEHETTWGSVYRFTGYIGYRNSTRHP